MKGREDMIETLPKKLVELAKACPFPLYVVGGTCREYLSSMFPLKPDYDICAPVPPETFAVKAEEFGFAKCAVYKNTGTVKMQTDDGGDYEFTSFRSDKYVRGVHKPANIYFTEDINLDARRRDFTCNAVYYDIKEQKFIDPLGGMDDIKRKVLRTVAPAEKVFGEDGLRLLRLARMCGATGFRPDEECMEGARHNCRLIRDISAERIYDEFRYILRADGIYGVKYGQYAALCIMRDTGVLGMILPELSLGAGMTQRQDFHMYDVLEHSLRCVMYAPDDIRLAALLHDVGKPYCKVLTGSYHDHEKEGARIAREICARLKVPKKLTEETVRLIELHMYDVDCKARESKIRRMIVSNRDIFFKLVALKQADYSACRDDLSEAPVITKWREIYGNMVAEKVPFNLRELKIKGDELIAAGIPRDKCGKVLDRLLLECAAFPQLNERNKLMIIAKRVVRDV